MQSISINGLMRRNLKFELSRRDSKRLYNEKKRRWTKDAKKYMSDTHDFVLFMGKVNTGIKRTMAGRDAKLANDMSIQKFIAGTVSKISTWRLEKEKTNVESY